MQKCDYIWMDGRLVPWDEALVSLATFTLHYGAGVFEGIKLYKTKQGPAIFRLDDHIKRLFDSFRIFGREIPFSKEEIRDAIIETVRANKLEDGYIRPIVYFGEEVLTLDVTNIPVQVAIAAWPWGKHLGDAPIKVMFSDIIRIHPKSTDVESKIIGHYVNSILSHMQAKRAGYDEALLCDYQGNVAEGAAENVFIVKDGVIKTPKLGSILPGITRESVITIAKDCGFKVIEESLSKDDLYNADEAFLTGSATDIAPICSIEHHSLPQENLVTQKLKEEFDRVIQGTAPRYASWLTYI